jgi:hypothetical protein
VGKRLEGSKMVDESEKEIIRIEYIKHLKDEWLKLDLQMTTLLPFESFCNLMSNYDSEELLKSIRDELRDMNENFDDISFNISNIG